MRYAAAWLATPEGLPPRRNVEEMRQAEDGPTGARPAVPGSVPLGDRKARHRLLGGLRFAPIPATAASIGRRVRPYVGFRSRPLRSSTAGGRRYTFSQNGLLSAASSGFGWNTGSACRWPHSKIDRLTSCWITLALAPELRRWHQIPNRVLALPPAIAARSSPLNDATELICPIGSYSPMSYG